MTPDPAVANEPPHDPPPDVPAPRPQAPNGRASTAPDRAPAAPERPSAPPERASSAPAGGSAAPERASAPPDRPSASRATTSLPFVPSAGAPDRSLAKAPARGGAVTFRGRAAQRWRFVRAYWTTFVVIGSYLWFALLRRVFGAAWAEPREGAVHARNAVRVERTIVQLQGLFIKVGQLLSIMANFLPKEFREGLEGLQDQVPPRPFAEIAARIEGELDRPVGDVFAKLSEEPLASASLGQVHEAWLRDGTHVAVKVQHRNIDEIVRLDLTTIRRIMAIVSWFLPIRGLDAYYHQIRLMILEELDFLREVRNIERVAACFAARDDVRFPRPIDGLCTQRVMVTTFVEGTKVGDTALLDAKGIDRKALSRKIIEVFCQQIFVDGVYHADPHPGNMLVGADGALVLLDFGAVAELSPQMREGIPEFLEGVIRRDTDAIIKALRKMGFLARTDAIDVSEKVIEFFHQRFQEEIKLESFNLKDIKIDPQKGIESLVDLRKMNIGLRELTGAFHVPRDFVLLERTILLLTGVCTQLDPELSPMEVIHPYLRDFVLGNRDWAQIALDAAKDTALKALTLPDDLRKYLTRANRGELEYRVKGLTQAAGLVYRGVRQLIYAAIGIAAGMASLQLYLAGHVAVARYCLYGAGFMGLVLVLSMALSRRG